MFSKEIISKADQVRKWLLEGIESGRFSKKNRLPSDNVLIRELNVSRSTVREALSSLVREGKIMRIQGKGSFVADSSMKVDKKELQDYRIVYLIVRDEHSSGESDPFVGEILKGMHSVLDEKGFSIRFNSFPPDEWFLSPTQIDSIIQSSPTGIIFAGFTVTKNIVRLFHRKNISCASIGRPKNGIDIPYADIDHKSGAKWAVDHLASLGHRKIGIIEFRGHLPSQKDRQSGFSEAFKTNGIEYNMANTVFIEHITVEEGSRAFEKIISKSPDTTAVIVYGDYSTLGVMQSIKATGKDISLVMLFGYNWVESVTGIKLTKVGQSVFELGKKTSELLLERNALSDKVILSPSFTIGKSTKKEKKSK